MNKRKQKDAEHKEYVALTISRSHLRSEFGDEVADKLTDEQLKDFAASLDDFYRSSTDDWKWILSEGFDIDFDD